MGKPYDIELKMLPQTYRWAISENIDKLCKAIESSAHLPLLAVGSGGSLSAAEAMVSCHESSLGGLARAVTPLELLTVLPQNGQTSVWFFSASGSNIDIRRAFKHTLLCEPRHVAALVGRTDSPLLQILNEHQYAELIELNLPSGHDGFLATNSLIAFSTLICRAYDRISRRNETSPLPDSYEALLNSALPENLSLDRIEEKSQRLWEMSTIHVLYSSELKCVATDIESKFIEAGLSSIHLADFRNFAHGRHHWIDKHSNTTAILAISVPNDHALAQETIGLIPTATPCLHIPIKSEGSSGLVSGMVLSLYLAGFAGKAKNIDPGQPGVPDFGGELYNLETGSGFTSSVMMVDAAIRRKSGVSSTFLPSGRRDLWATAYNVFKHKLLTTEFSGVIMDYDGTIVDSRDRYSPPKDAIVEQMIRLLSVGITLGFATGRGQSIRRDLRKVIPEQYWNLVFVGYYNGAEISLLTDNSAPDGESPPCMDLQRSFQELNNSLEISSLAKVDPRKFQITVEPKHLIPENHLYELAQNLLYVDGSESQTIFRSSHSIDILAQGVSKVSVINHLLKTLGEKANVLTIGDRGKWPGNDFMLLKHIHSLSVDEVSPCHNTCWNLCPSGVRGPQGTLYYLKHLEVASFPTQTVKLILED